MPQRFVESRIDAVEKTTAGLRVTATPTRPGVFTYTRADGSTVRELRHPDQVFHADSLASLEDVPVTINHPRGGMSPAAFARESVGHVRAGSVRADTAAAVVRADMVIGREDAQALAATKPELSSGYDCQIDRTPGEWNGERYDQAQVNIRYNHVAVLKGQPGRMGSVCRLDAAGEQITDTDEQTNMKIKIGDKTYETEAEIQTAVSQLAARADAADAQIATLSGVVARHDAETAKAKRAALESTVKGVLGAEFKCDGQTDRALRVAVIQRADSAFNGEGQDDVYVVARFDATLAESARAAAVVNALNGSGGGNQSRADAGDDRAAALKAKHLKSAQERGASVVE